jgi:hypothetical protein
LATADEEARASGRSLVRVDCFAGNNGALVRFYESCGFVATDAFTVGDWPGRVLERRLRAVSVRDDGDRAGLPAGELRQR